MVVHPRDVLMQSTLKKCRRFKLLKPRWVDRHFILYKRDRNRDLYSIDECKTDKKFEPKRTYFLENLLKVVSNLTIPDSSLACSTNSQNFHWIFSVTFLYNNEIKDIFLVANSKQEMKQWVNELCHLGRLEKEEDELVRSQPPSTSFRAASDSSASLETSVEAEAPPRSENRYLRLKNMSHRINSIQRSGARSEPCEIGETSSVSGASSVYSTKRTTTLEEDDDDCLSTQSNSVVPPLPARSIRSQSSMRSNGGTNRGRPVWRENEYDKRNEKEDSSAETIKFEMAPRLPSYAESLTSSEGANTFYTNTSSLNFDQPPPVDRSKKPANFIINDERRMMKNKRYNSLNNRNPVNGNNQQRMYASYSRTMTRDVSKTPKNMKIDYFEPQSLNIGTSVTQSPSVSDIEYISVDVDRTMAFKQMRQPM